jgi:hypothetical protein
MDVASLIPTPDAIPVHWAWLKLLLLLTFTLHLLAMNLMLGGSLLALAGRLRGVAPPAETRSLPILIALAVNLGVPPLLFLQTLYGQFLYSSSILMAVFWLSIVPVLIAAYYAAYGFAHRHKAAASSATSGAGAGSGAGTSSGADAVAGTGWLAAAALLLLYVGFMLSNNMTLMARPERWSAYFDHPAGTFLNLNEPTLWPRFLHFVTASIAVAALGRAVYLEVMARRTGADHGGAIRASLRLFAWTTMAQVLLGVLFWITLPGHIGALFAGGSIRHTAHLGAAVVLALAAIAVALRGKLRLTAALAVVLVVDMVLVRDLVRSAYLGSLFSPGDLEVASQPGPMIWFFAAFVAVGAILVFTLRAAWRPRQEA